ncbi:MAG TPA: tRNA epoxyqueuosine(34) reductase QueG [Cytophagaceae bacterium]|jgi:epoxyqueuosine reductase|nr:tRNA epoxyqueuosine(34) reductase QueG [Cytophagaceae bacterium]
MKSYYTQLIKNKTRELGFEYCGISKAGFLAEEAPQVEEWLKAGRHGTMGWMENHFDKRLDPRLLVEGAKSVVSLLLNYYPEQELENSTYKISKYAYGKDYHFVIKDKLKELVYFLKKEVGDINGRAFVDSAPVMDKVWAKKSGLGWVGKNTNLINRETGSFFFIAELIIDIELEYDGPIKDYCGTCTRCVDACPTDALQTPYEIDGSRCISYLTIELKENIPEEFKDKMDNWIFGCDVCQDVCPWNRFSKKHTQPSFIPSDQLLAMENKDWEEITEEAFGLLFKDSSIKRSKYKGLSRNITFVKNTKIN